MSKEIKNHLTRNALSNYIGKEIIIVSHTKARIEGLEAAWYKKPKRVKLLEYIEPENLIKIELNKKKFEVKLNTLDEILA